MKFDLLSRAITAATLIALAVTLGIWLSRAPLTAAPATTPVKTAPEPTLAPLPATPAVTPPAPIMPAVIEVPVEVEIADVSEPTAAKPAEPKSESYPTSRPRHRGPFHRR
jgi:hypothetical protein